MSGTGTCPSCGAELPPDAPKGWCPRCLYRMGLDGTGKSDLPHQPDTILEPSGLAGAPGFPEIRSFGDYELLEEIGHGGMGLVYKARQKSLDRVVALKLLLFGPHASPESVKRFRAEAVATAALQHPHIVAIHEVGFCEGQHFIAMDYVEGQCLSALIHGSPLPAQCAAGYVRTIAQAIHYAHEHGILHRDLKPANVLIDTSDQPRVTDFGLARRLEGDSELTVTGQVLGSPNYMPPEQATGRRGALSRRSDVYALGGILYQALTGRPPFVGEGMAETVQQVLNAEPVSPRVLNPSVPADLETVCLKCLEKEPAKRYATAQMLAEELGRFLEGKPVQARPVGRLAKGGRWCRRNPVRAWLITAVIAVSALGAVGVLWQWRRAAQERDRQALFAYASDMRAAHAAVLENNLGQAKDLLLRHVPRARQTDLRGLEWRYLWLKSRGDDVSTFRHKSRVEAADISPDGYWVATECAGEILVWDASRRQPVKRFQTVPGEYGPLRSHLAFCATGRYFAAQGPGGLTIWDTATWGRLTTLPGTNLQPVFSGDGRVLAAICDGGMRVWETGTWRRSITPAEATEAGRADLALAINHDGSLLAFASEDLGQVTVWDLPKHALYFRVVLPRVSKVALSPDNRWLAAGTWSGHLYTWDLRDGRMAANSQAHPYFLAGLAFAPDGSTLVSGGNDQLLRFWEPGTTNLLGTLRGHESEIWDARFSGDGRWLVTASKDMTARVWAAAALASTHPTFHLPMDHLIGELSPEGSAIMTVNTKTWALEEWDTARSQVLKQVIITPTNQFQRLTLTFYPWMHRVDPEAFATGKNGSALLSVAVARGPWGLAAGTCDGRILAWDRQTGGLVYSNKVGQGGILVQPLPPFPDGKHLYFMEVTGRGHFSLVWWNLLENRPEVVIRDFKGFNLLLQVPFSRDGVWMADRSGARSIAVRNLKTGRVRTISTGQTMVVGCAAFSPDGRLVATGSDDGTVRLWETQSGRPFGPVLRGHLSGIHRIEFSSDGRTLLTYSDIIYARVWNVATGQQMLSPLPGGGLPYDHILHGVFSHDERLLVEPEGDSQVRFVRLPTFAEIEAADW